MSQVWSVRGHGTEIDIDNTDMPDQINTGDNKKEREEKDIGEKCHDIWYWICLSSLNFQIIFKYILQST